MIRPFIMAWTLMSIASLSPAHDSTSQRESPRIICVSGNAAVKLKPDQIRITLGITTFHKEARQAKDENDSKTLRVLAALKKRNLPGTDYQTESFQLAPVYEDHRYQDRLDKVVGYSASNYVVVTLRKVDELKELITESIEAGANCVSGIQFETTKLRELRDQARKMAIRAAKEKAELIAAEIGQKIGKARVIQEAGDGDSSYAIQNQVMQSGGLFGGGQGGGRFVDDDSTGDTFAAGEVEIRASVAVTFDLD